MRSKIANCLGSPLLFVFCCQKNFHVGGDRFSLTDRMIVVTRPLLFLYLTDMGCHCHHHRDGHLPAHDPPQGSGDLLFLILVSCLQLDTQFEFPPQNYRRTIRGQRRREVRA